MNGSTCPDPGIGDVTGARTSGESLGDAPGRDASAKARKNYAGTFPLTIESGKKKTVHARYIRNIYVWDALHAQALSAPHRIPRSPWSSTTRSAHATSATTT